MTWQPRCFAKPWLTSQRKPSLSSPAAAGQSCLPGAVSYVGCYIDKQRYISDVTYYNDNPAQGSRLCGSTTQQLDSTPLRKLYKSIGEVITSIRVCSDGVGATGLVFGTSLGQSLECGSTSSSSCRVVSGGGASGALAGFTGTCSSAGSLNRLQDITSPCWNQGYTQAVSPSELSAER